METPTRPQAAPQARPQARPQIGALRYEDKRTGTRLGTILDGLLEKFGGPFSSSALKHSMAISQAWNEIAGQHAAYCTPGKLDTSARCLHVIASSSRHASVIRWDTAQMVARIADVLGEDIVREIFVLTLPPKRNRHLAQAEVSENS